MTITDKTALDLLKKADSEELSEKVTSYPDDEIDGKTDVDIVIDEIEYLIWMYEEDDTIQYQNLQLSKQILRDTDDGKVMPLHIDTLLPKYSSSEINDSKTTVAEYNRLKKIIKDWYSK